MTTEESLMRAAALDAQPETVAGETVTVRVCVGRSDDGSYYAYGANGESDDELRSTVEGADYEPICFANIHAPAHRPPLPTIPATVEPGA